MLQVTEPSVLSVLHNTGLIIISSQDILDRADGRRRPHSSETGDVSCGTEVIKHERGGDNKQEVMTSRERGGGGGGGGGGGEAGGEHKH